MVNPFYVNPLGGADIAGGVGQLVGAVKASSDQEAAKIKQAQQMEEARGVLSSGDPEAISDFMLANPKLSQQLSGAFNFKNEATKQNMLGSMQRIISGEDPEQVIRERVGFVEGEGGDASGTTSEISRYRADPENYIKSVETAYSMADPQGYKSLISGRQEGLDARGRDTANIKDFNRYQELLKADPAAAEQFAQLTGIAKEPDKPKKPTVLQQNFELWKKTPPGPEKTALAKMLNIAPKDTAASIEKKIKAVEDKKKEVIQARSTAQLIEDFINNEDYMDSMSGYTGALPTISTSGRDAETAFNSMLDNLTVENLKKMTGPLTDKDIALLASAASGIKAGMSKKAMKEKFEEIRDKLRQRAAEASRGIDEKLLSDETLTLDDIKKLSDEELLGAY